MKRPKMSEAEYRTAYILNNLHNRLGDLTIRIDMANERIDEWNELEKLEVMRLVGIRQGIEAAISFVLANEVYPAI